jgi:hypothetical protein
MAEAARKAAWIWIGTLPLRDAIEIVLGNDYPTQRHEASPSPVADVDAITDADFALAVASSPPSLATIEAAFKPYHFNLALSIIASSNVAAATAIVDDVRAIAARSGSRFPVFVNERSFNILLAAAARSHDADLVRKIMLIMRTDGVAAEAPAAQLVANMGAETRADERAVDQPGAATTLLPETRRPVLSTANEAAVNDWLSRLEKTSRSYSGNEEPSAKIDVLLHEAAAALYRLGKPGAAVEVLLDAPRRFGVKNFHGDALRTHASGLLYSGGLRSHGLEPAAIPRIWGGKAVDASTAAAAAASTPSGAAPRCALPWPLHKTTLEAVDLTSLGKWLQEYRAAAFQASRGKARLPPTDSIVSEMRARRAADKAAAARGSRLVALPPPLAEYAVVDLLRDFRVWGDGSALGGGGRGAGLAAGNSSPDFDPSADAAPDALAHAGPLAARALPLQADEGQDDPLMTLLPRVIGALRSGSAQTSDDEVGSAADAVVHRAFRSVPPLRALQLLLLFYRSGALGASRFVRSAPLSALSRNITAINALDTRSDTVAAFLLVALSEFALSTALDRVSVSMASGADLWVLAGHGSNRASERAAYAMSVELGGGDASRGLAPRRSPRALHLPWKDIYAWVEAETRAMKATL